jgi:hypothetical protein
VPVTCSEACRYTVELRLDRRTAKRLRVPARLARAAGSLTTAGRRAVKLRPAARTARRLERARRLRAVLTVRATDAAGNAASLRRKVRFR